MFRLETVPIKSITVGDRSRKSTANIGSLKKSIQSLGLMLQPIVCDPSLQLIAGSRRLAAAKELGWHDVPCYIVDSITDALGMLKAERDENTEREALTPAEAVVMGRRLEELERPAAAARKAVDGKQTAKADPDEKGRTDEKAAEGVGMSRSNYRKAKEIAEAAEAKPKLYGDLPEMMNERNVDAAYKELHKRKAAQQMRSAKVCDDAGAEVPPKLRDTFSDTWPWDLLKEADAVRERCMTSKLFAAVRTRGPDYRPAMQHGQIARHLANAAAEMAAAVELIQAGLPSVVCGKCGGNGGGCRVCGGAGWLSAAAAKENS